MPSTGDADSSGGVDVGADQPGPDRPLVVGRVAVGRVSAVVGPVRRVVRRERPQPERREQRAPAHVDGGAGGIGAAGQRRVGKRDCEELIRADRSVIAAGAVHDVEEARAVRPYEARDERRLRAIGEIREPICRGARALEPRGNAERPHPQRIHLDRLTCTRGDGNAVDPGVHPGQRPAFGTLPEQAVGGVDADPEPRSLEVVVDDLADDRRELAAEIVVAGRGDVAVERVHEPERPVDRVVLQRAGVGGVRQHPLGHGRGRGSQHLAALGRTVGASGRAPRRRSSGRATTRRTTDSRRPPSDGLPW